MKILGEKIFAKDESGRLLSRIGTMFFKTPGLVTARTVHAMQRMMWLDDINATRAAMDENCCYDAAECVANFVRSELCKESTSAFAGKYDDVKDKTGSDWSDITGFTETTSSGAKSGLRSCSTQGIFLFTRLGDNDEEIFSAVVKVWSVSGDLKSSLYIPDVEDAAKKPKPAAELKVSGGGAGSLGTEFEKFAKSAMVEITWGDNKRVFRVDVYKPYYTPGAAAP